MANIYNGTITANDTSIELRLYNIRGVISTYTIWVWGTFGSGTVTVTGSPDGGTTDITLLDNAGTPLTFTANGVRDFLLNSDPQDPIVVTAALTGATNPNVNIRVDRNN